MHPSHFRRFIVRPALQHIDLWSPEAEELLMLTWATESFAGQVVKQGLNNFFDGAGVALGPFQHEPNTYGDDWANYLRFNRPLQDKVYALSRFKTFPIPPAEDLIGNFPFAAAMCRVHYRRFAEPIPPRGAYTAKEAWIVGLAAFYKRYWNTEAGKATVEKAISDYTEYVHGL